MSLSALDFLREGLAAILFAAAAAFLAGGALGALHLKDAYSRLHAIRLATGYGAPAFLAALAFEAWSPGVAVLLLVMAATLLAIGPALAHLMVNAVYDVARAGRTGTGVGGEP